MLRAAADYRDRPGGAGTACFRSRALAVVGVAASLVLAGWSAPAAGQTRLPPPTSASLLPVATASPALPEPIFWKQHLFLIPYKWGSAAEPGAAQSVHLYVSKDRGTSWQKISDAKPQVTAFNYRAEGDGEYWFAVRTLDTRGRLSPEGAYQPELRVIVDTVIPRFDELRAYGSPTGTLEVQCRATDVNLDPTTLRIETQANAAGPWQPATGQGVRSADQGTGSGLPGSLLQASFQPAGGVRPNAVRATIADRAGNSAVYQTKVDAEPPLAGPMLPQSAVVNAAVSPFPVPSVASGSGLPIAPPLASALPSASPTPTSPATQTWPAGTMASAPFRLWTSNMSPQDDGRTAYGNPSVSSAPPSLPLTAVAQNAADVGSGWTTSTENETGQRVPASYAGITKVEGNPATAIPNAAPQGPQFAPLEPFRQSTAATLSSAAIGPQLVPLGQLSSQPIGNGGFNNQTVTPIDTRPPARGPSTPPKLVGSRTFALEYDLDDASGVSRVELWGTRDGGQTWNRYSQDDDNRSPLVVTVDDEGLYGFRILVQSASGAAAEPPRAGDEPELWVAVDLQRPIVELTSIERGEGNQADHLNLRWRVQDNNLEPRPISLYFSSRPTGPWSAIATNLEDTGQYAWRVERYVPTRIYLRIEARDTAGNLAAFQTREPVEFSASAVKAQLRGTQPTGSSATAPVGRR